MDNHLKLIVNSSYDYKKLKEKEKLIVRIFTDNREQKIEIIYYKQEEEKKVEERDPSIEMFRQIFKGEYLDKN